MSDDHDHEWGWRHDGRALLCHRCGLSVPAIASCWPEEHIALTAAEKGEDVKVLIRAGQVRRQFSDATRLLDSSIRDHEKRLDAHEKSLDAHGATIREIASARSTRRAPIPDQPRTNPAPTTNEGPKPP